LENLQISDSIKMHPMGTESSPVNRRTKRHDKTSWHFVWFCGHASKWLWWCEPYGTGNDEMKLHAIVLVVMNVWIT